MKRTIIVFAVALAVLFAVGSMSYSQEQNTQKNETSGSTSKEQKTICYCPMHPEVVSNNPGRCPECGMNLEKKKAKNEHEETYACPMHSDVVSNKPGKCPKCGMNLALREQQKENAGAMVSGESSPKDKILKAKAMLEEAKKVLAQDGKYNCCIKDPCDRCALDHQSCPCGDEVKAGKAVCPDCYAGWQRGDGIVPGVKASGVKGEFHSHKH